MSRFLLVDDHELIRAGLKSILAEELGAHCFGEATNAAEAIELARHQAWDVALVELALGGRSSLELLKDLKESHPRLPVLVLTAHTEEQFARRVFKAGAAGYLTKDCSRGELARAVQKVLAGGVYVSPGLAERLVGDYRHGSDAPRHQTLSDREFEVMRLIASGRTVSEIGLLLSLSVRTVSTYRSRLLVKLDMKTNAELTRYAIENKLVD